MVSLYLTYNRNKFILSLTVHVATMKCRHIDNIKRSLPKNKCRGHACGLNEANDILDEFQCPLTRLPIKAGHRLDKNSFS
jgi:hypothetical protein